MADGASWRAIALVAKGIYSPTLACALRAGTLERVSRGTYCLASGPPPADMDLAMACLRVPRVLVCMMSADHLHNLIEAAPRELWLAVPGGSSVASIDHADIRILHWKYAGAFEVGVKHRRVRGIEMQVTDDVRTVVDLLRYARHVGGEEVGLVVARRFLTSGGRCAELRNIALAVGAPATVHRALGILGAFEEGST